MGLVTGLLTTAAVVGAGISSYGAYREGMDAKEATEYNANVSRQEAQLAEQQAGMFEASGALDARRQREATARLVSKQKALYGASGVELSGSPLDVMINTSAEGELDAQIMEYNAKIKARNARMTAYGLRSQADYELQTGERYAQAGMIRAGSTLLTQGSNIYTKYVGFGKDSY